VLNYDGIAIRSTFTEPKVSVHYAALVTQLFFKTENFVKKLESAPLKFAVDDRRVLEAKPEAKDLKAGKGPSTTVARDDGPAVQHIRIRTQKNELLIAPGPNYLLVVVQLPDATLGSISVSDSS